MFIDCQMLLCIDNLKRKYEILDVIDCDNLSIVELYIKIKNVARDEFCNNQRIIFTLTTDKHNQNSGIILHSIQSIVNTVNIGNFFVCVITTNPEVKDQYNFLLTNISTDKTPIHIYQCPGNYTKLIASTNEIPFIKHANISDHLDDIVALSELEKYLLFENKNFCIMPWVGINIQPDSSTRICCESTQVVGDSSKSSLKEIWNSEELMKIRKTMLAGKVVDSCKNCVDKEMLGRDSLRNSTNRKFLNKIYKIKKTSETGFLDEFKLNYWDIRYNNLCNLQCRSCSPGSSSSWYDPAIKLGIISKKRSPILIAGNQKSDLIFKQIVDHADDVETIYFAGGEPLIIENFYKILEILDNKKRHNVNLIYNTNMTKMYLKNKKIFNLWNKFRYVSVGASLDGSYKRGEYLRQGLKWDEVVNNRRDMMKECPQIDFYVSATVSIINAIHLPDFHKEWVDLGLIQPENFNIQMLFGPDWLRADSAPENLKKQIKDKYTKHLEWLVPNDSSGRASYGFKSVLNFLEYGKSLNYENFWKNVNALDKYHNTDLLEVFPELSMLKDKLL